MLTKARAKTKKKLSTLCPKKINHIVYISSYLMKIIQNINLILDIMCRSYLKLKIDREQNSGLKRLNSVFLALLQTQICSPVQALENSSWQLNTKPFRFGGFTNAALQDKHTIVCKFESCSGLLTIASSGGFNWKKYDINGILSKGFWRMGIYYSKNLSTQTYMRFGSHKHIL